MFLMKKLRYIFNLFKQIDCGFVSTNKIIFIQNKEGNLNCKYKICQEQNIIKFYFKQYKIDFEFKILYIKQQDKIQEKNRFIKSFFEVNKSFRIIYNECDIEEYIQQKAFSCQFSKEFIFASKQNRLEKMQNFLITHPYLVFQYDYYNMTALHWACKYGYLDMVRMLLDYHTDFDALNLMNRTPFSIAIIKNHQEIVKLLLTNGSYPWILYNQIKRQRILLSKQEKYNKWSRIKQTTFCIY
ncbi:unnamed protein product [Paramecium primaurelia]|uniref:Ankyrin repeat protein n=1 Tax=Paramecium primaurelia TaxID=5886 RepID=A0A8S1P4C0_PARPR|nr:unnamed protein product [Paramecium primaurelia]